MRAGCGVCVWGASAGASSLVSAASVASAGASWLDVRVLRALKFGRFIREGSRPARAQSSPV